MKPPKGCPLCGTKSQVTDSRQLPAPALRRRRKCPACAHRYSTRERVTTEPTKKRTKP